MILSHKNTVSTLSCKNGKVPKDRQKQWAEGKDLLGECFLSTITNWTGRGSTIWGTWCAVVGIACFYLPFLPLGPRFPFLPSCFFGIFIIPPNAALIY
jgi:hypothetical protein